MTEDIGKVVKKAEPEEIANEIERKVSQTEVNVKENTEGVKEKKQYKLWISIDKKNINNLIKFIKENYHFPHFTSMVGNDLEDKIVIRYNISIFYEERFGEISIMIETNVPKEDLTLPTITNEIKGALTSEREIQEMFGIEIKNIPDDRNLYLPYNQSDDENPWRKDDKGPEMEDLYSKEQNRKENLELYSEEKIEDYEKSDTDEEEEEVEESERKYEIDSDACIGCQQCVSECPVDAITGDPGSSHEIDREICIACGSCETVCPVDAISLEGDSDE